MLVWRSLTFSGRSCKNVRFPINATRGPFNTCCSVTQRRFGLDTPIVYRINLHRYVNSLNHLKIITLSSFYNLHLNVKSQLQPGSVSQFIIIKNVSYNNITVSFYSSALINDNYRFVLMSRLGLRCQIFKLI